MESPHRLPATVVPERYEIRLTPDLSDLSFHGEERVYVTVREPVSEIVLNARDLVIREVSVVGQSGEKWEAKPRLDEKKERLIALFPESLRPGPWQLLIAFSGILNPKLEGFYHSAYEIQGQKKILAATQFEATHARQAFPCWDEPALKAVFQVTLVVDEGLTAISNTAILRESAIPARQKKEIVFHETIRMSSYLVAFIVGEFESSDPVHVDGTPVRVWAVPGKRHLANFAREIGAFSLSYFARYYDLPYPGDKLDLIAIPDFASGAMENLGAITFRETALLVDDESATHAERERVADVVSHENAHMWFGDLVTMRWWNGLWLNEAFATFMEIMSVDAWKPAWRRWESFSLSRAAATLVDGLKSTRPVEYAVEKPEEAAAMFDVLTYEKGASVLRMLEQYLGPEIFRDGIRLYLRKHQYGNAETTDLWDAIEESSGQPVRALMDSWIFQAGYPLVTARVEKESLYVSQQIFRYLQDGDAPDRLWHIPVQIRARTRSGLESRTLLLTEKEARVDLSEPPGWVVVNAGGHGFYRVRYAPDLLRRLLSEAVDDLSAAEKFHLINDVWATTLAGLVPLGEYLDLLTAFRNETDRNVWSAIIGSLHYLQRVMEPAQWPALQSLVRELVGPAAARLGWNPREGEPERTRQLRGELFAVLGTLGEDRTVQAEARRLYENYKRGTTSVDQNVIPALIAIVAHTGGAREYQEFFGNFKNARTPQEEQRYLFALADFRPPDLKERTLALALNGNVRSQNAPYLMRALLWNPEGRERAWRFMKEHWEEMLQRYPDNSIARMCEGITALATPQLEADVSNFFASHPVKQAGKIIEQHLEKLRIAVACKVRWRDAFTTDHTMSQTRMSG
ncbi:MAG: M1 family metallopeptidase [Deltaproteobacteria bacterium]|nr:M1 family metallopeptidase [Deltaproteobacteria bacterium]